MMIEHVLAAIMLVICLVLVIWGFLPPMNRDPSVLLPKSTRPAPPPARKVGP